MRFAFFVASVYAHGGMITPPPRNAIDSEIPGMNWGNGSTRTGKLEPLGVGCKNGTGTDACHPGQTVFWFSQGCTQFFQTWSRGPAILIWALQLPHWHLVICI